MTGPLVAPAPARGEDPAHPVTARGHTSPGLTVREHVATQALAGLLAAGHDSSGAARLAVDLTDALLAELGRPAPSGEAAYGERLMRLGYASCPKCGGDRLTTTNSDWGQRGTWDVHLECRGCAYEWIEEYEYAGYHPKVMP